MEKSRIFPAELGLYDPGRELPPFHFGRLTNGTWASITPNPEINEAGNTFEYYFKDEGFYLWPIEIDLVVMNRSNGSLVLRNGQINKP